MDYQPVLLRHEYEIWCDEQHYVDEDRQLYHLALDARGLMRRDGMTWETSEHLIAGYGMSEGDGGWIPHQVPMKHAPGMSVGDAMAVLQAVFADLKYGSSYDGDFAIIPIDLGHWLHEKLDPGVADHVERALRAAVAINNAGQTN